MSYLNAIVGFFVDALMRPFDRPWSALVAAAFVTAFLMLLIIRWTSSPAAIRRAKNRLIARVLELVLFRNDALVSFTAGGRILAANGFYLLRLLRPVLFSAVPFVLILTQLTCWFAIRPLHVGETTILEIKLREGLLVTARSVVVSGNNAIDIETSALHIPRLSEIDWRLRGVQDGVDSIEIEIDHEVPVSKQIVVGETLQKVSQRRTGSGLRGQFLFPAEPPIDAASSVAEVNVRYPMRRLYLANREIDWLLAFVVLTMIFGLILKCPLRVEL